MFRQIVNSDPAKLEYGWECLRRSGEYTSTSHSKDAPPTAQLSAVNRHRVHLLQYPSMNYVNCLLYFLLGITGAAAISPAQRRDIVRSFNPHRNASSPTTPLQVGNGDFAFGADITGLQTFSQFAIQSSWAWHNFSLPTTPGQTSTSGSVLPLPDYGD